MSPEPPIGVTFDAGALIAIERSSPAMAGLLRGLTQQRIHIPAGVLGQVWRGGQRQARLSLFLRATQVKIEPLDEVVARAAGVLCAKAATADVIDASVVICARRYGTAVVTSDPDDLAKLDRQLVLVTV